jgi:hypothetical protein
LRGLRITNATTRPRHSQPKTSNELLDTPPSHGLRPARRMLRESPTASRSPRLGV